MIFTTRRQKEYRITTPIDPQGLKYSQPKRYTMKEIGELGVRKLIFQENFVHLYLQELLMEKL